MLSRALRLIKSDSSIFLFERLLRSFGTFVFLLVAARSLGPEMYGLMSVMLAFCSIISIASNMGMDSVIVNELVVSKTPKLELLGTGFWLRVGITAICYLICGLGLFWYSGSYQMSILLLAMCISLFFQCFDVLDYYCQSESRLNETAKARILSDVISIAIKLLIAIYSTDIYVYCAVVMVENVITAILYRHIAYNLKIAEFVRKFNRKVAINIVKKSAHLLIYNICVVITMQIDKIILGFEKGNQEVGVYSAALQLVSIWNIVPLALAAAQMPVITKKYLDDATSMDTEAKNVFSSLSRIAVALTLLTIFCGQFIIPPIFGDKYSGSAELLYIAGWQMIFIFHVSLRTRFLVMQDRLSEVSGMAVMTAVIALITFYLAIKFWGVTGAACSTVLVWAFSVIIAPLFYKEIRSYPATFVKSLYI